jgi:hypothetical protein
MQIYSALFENFQVALVLRMSSSGMLRCVAPLGTEAASYC